jgi:hypothetical protein
VPGWVESLWLVPGHGTPQEWFICFSTRARFWWASAAALGRYKHVSCFAFVAAVDGWLFYDFGLNQTVVTVLPDRQANALIGAMADDALVVKWIPPLVVTGVRLKPAFLCTTAIAHLTGVPSCALRPDRFLRDCLAAGGKVVAEPQRHELRTYQPAARPGAGT